VALKYAQNTFTEKKYKDLFEHLWLLYEIESRMNDRLREFDRNALIEKVFINPIRVKRARQ
jgi:hypothetical protein